MKIVPVTDFDPSIKNGDHFLTLNGEKYILGKDTVEKLEKLLCQKIQKVYRVSRCRIC